MYLSRIKLDTGLRETKRAMASPQVIHAAIESCFSTKGRNLWRLDYFQNNFFLLLVSETTPNFESFTKQFCAKNIYGESKPYLPIILSIKTGQQLRFRLKGNTVNSKATERGKRGKVLPHKTDHHKKEWLISKAAANGFSLESFDLIESGEKQFWRGSKKIELTFGIFEGILKVEDSALFTKALTGGIGRAKAYGCGLITVTGVK